jgi:hypothetical protein
LDNVLEEQAGAMAEILGVELERQFIKPLGL